MNFSQNTCLALLIASNFFSSVAVSIGMYIIPWYISNDGEQPRLLAMMATMSSLTLIFITPWIGMLVDKFNRKNLLTALNVLICIAFILAICSRYFSFSIMLPLVASYFVVQFYYAIFYIARQGFIKDIFSGDYLSRTNSLLEMESQASTLISALLVISVSSYLSYDTIFVLLVVLIVISLFILLAIPYQRRSPVNAQMPKSSLIQFQPENRNVILYLLIGAVPFVCIMVVNVIQAPFMHEVLHASIESYASFGIIYGLGAILVSLLLGWLAPKFPARKLVHLFTGGFALTVLLIASSPTLPVILCGAFFLGLFNSASRISSQNVVLTEIDSEKIGRVFSTGQLFTLINRVLATGLVVILFQESYEYAWSYVLMISAIAPVSLMLWSFYANRPQKIRRS
ncbi:MFS transporter [Serratia ficaria]|uniref:2-acyl-glycerophospho-ethanolamine acyltransferase n=1 Tax=Serratia ficaria TaxID=61651 RepID=A0A240A846_SERFI|nr:MULTISPECIES: MFS transporter [Serratia]MEE4483428.1 MFS transporter [Serratia ficaria]REF42632.1 putative MFS family arabinose efflux permease [Serratia ficaria]CAI0910400.1 2-acyl-glycerophospho-ethanolamine acyltransferase [Serratia ficaria]CAI0914729.1 2-acyl-glycerophospho-ethanolamine acyltransferase [Serratia ficaria]CAI1070632.1 2-acyl-glycerophospho-ethanolamine acyltransferase [Serratia ficaria]